MPAADTITLTLAVFGSLGTVAQVYSTVRDRPRLRMYSRIVTSVQQSPRLGVSVANTGSRPTTVRVLGLYAHTSRVEIQSQAEGRLQQEAELGRTVAEGVFLEPGQTREFELTLDQVASIGAWADEPIRIYARDIHNRRVWGDAAPFLREMVGSVALEGLPDNVVKIFQPPPEHHRLPAQVEPGWKLWKRRELRRPHAWRSE